MAKKKQDISKGVKNPDNSPKERPKSGRGAMNGVQTGVSFTKDNQPSGAAKAAGKFRAKTLRQLLESPLAKGRLPNDMQQILQEMYAAYGISKEQIDVRLFMDMKMISQAIKTGDVAAYKAVLDRVYGRPREEQAPIVDNVNEEGERTSFTLPGGIDLEI